ncbi:cytochrome P450 [Coccidioides immitis RMSCC 2394]|uniref:Cytochrome P450 n=1 Tax=Coccidioides immitis RMSCC 2394 TaxID=404692 RepID=A0A0J7B8Y3_COCIT|nr:cytochrome P450 [Coccidioides immitis RMSCC 2394]
MCVDGGASWAYKVRQGSRRSSAEIDCSEVLLPCQSYPWLCNIGITVAQKRTAKESLQPHWLYGFCTLSRWRSIACISVHWPSSQVQSSLRSQDGGDMNIQLIFVTGPIVRVTPDEVHIRDAQFYDQMYAKNPRRNPPPASRGLESYVRAASIQIYLRTTSLIISHRFSRRAILVLEPVVREYVALLCKRVAEYATKSKPLAITVAHSAYTGDVIVEYSFGFSYRHLENPNFESFHDALMVMGLSAHLASQFSWFLPLVNSLPDWFVEKIQPDPASLLRLRRDHWDLIGQIIRGEEAVSKVKLHPTIFHEILRSSLPPEEKSQQRLLDEAQIVVAAGRLHKEVADAFPDKNVIPSLLELEKLPYMKTCIQESLRHFPDSHSFIPERWLDNPKTSDGTPLERYLVAFGRGPRACLGLNPTHSLARAELNYAFGTVFRRFEFELYETDITDVKYKHDFFNPPVKMDSKGVRLLVSEVSD